jgi:cytochrome c oxidase cbb3-type subunit 1
MWDYIKLLVLGVTTILAAIGVQYGWDLPYKVNAAVVMLAAAATFIYTPRGMEQPKLAAPMGEYNDGMIRAGVIATTFWGVVRFLVGVLIAFQLAIPALNIEVMGILNFGRLRPLHTSAVIFAFGGNALIMSAFYIVQRTSGVRLWGGGLAWFVFWGWQLMMVLAATSYILGGTQGKEYADTVSAKFTMYMVRGLGGLMYLTGAFLMTYNMWMTVRALPSKAAVNTNTFVPA